MLLGATINNLKSIIVLWMMVLFIVLPSSIAHAGTPDCKEAYEQAIRPYWLIANDILSYKALFDDYDRLCTQHYPNDIAALQPAADRLRSQTTQDVRNTFSVIDHVFGIVLPKQVSEKCSVDLTARSRVRDNVVTAMKRQTKVQTTRLRSSASSVQDTNLKICRDLKKFRPMIERTLGPDLKNPLLEMSVLNSTMVRHDSAMRKDALKVWRKTLKSVGQN